MKMLRDIWYGLADAVMPVPQPIGGTCQCLCAKHGGDVDTKTKYVEHMKHLYAELDKLVEQKKFITEAILNRKNEPAKVEKMDSSVDDAPVFRGPWYVSFDIKKSELQKTFETEKEALDFAGEIHKRNKDVTTAVKNY